MQENDKLKEIKKIEVNSSQIRDELYVADILHRLADGIYKNEYHIKNKLEIDVKKNTVAIDGFERKIKDFELGLTEILDFEKHLKRFYKFAIMVLIFILGYGIKNFPDVVGDLLKIFTVIL